MTAQTSVVTVGDTSRVALEAAGGSRFTWAFDSLSAGSLELQVGLTPGDGRATGVKVRVLGKGLFGFGKLRQQTACQVTWTAAEHSEAWQPCTLELDRNLSAGLLEVEVDGPADSSVWISAPLLTTDRRSDHFPVFFFVLDTARADSFQSFNDGTLLGGGLARLAADGVTFKEARSVSSWTRTAVASMLTGLFPRTHRVLDRTDVMRPELVTLPEVLQRAGYTTVAWSTNPNVLPIWGFSQGFDAFTDVDAGSWAKHKTDAAEVLDLLRGELERYGRSPVFYYVHLMDPHAPYRPDQVALERIRDSEGQLWERPLVLADENNSAVASAYEKYLAEVLGMDEQLDRFFSFLREEGLYEDSLIVLVSDHGEEFLEHGAIYHGKTLYEEMLRVPVIIKLPRKQLAGQVFRGPITVSDIMPTVLAALGTTDQAPMEGRALLRRDPGSGRIGFSIKSFVDLPTVAQLALDGIDLETIIDGRWKLIVDRRTSDRKLYDLSHDPAERHDLAGDQAERAERMAQLLLGIRLASQQGWHVSGCGALHDAKLDLVLHTADAQVRGALLEDSDAIAADEDRRSVVVTFNLARLDITRESMGRLSSKKALDRDEVLIWSESETPIKLTPAPPVLDTMIPWAAGTQDLLRFSKEIDFSAFKDQMTVTQMTVPLCNDVKLGGFGGEAIPELPRGPYLRIWYVPPPVEVPAAVLGPSIIERLRALGYVN
ncbi:MAG: sulfatase [Deltaproteobacteria bacterium]